MKASRRRLSALEKLTRRHTGCAVISLADGETLDQAVTRLGLTHAGGCIVVGEILSPEIWCERAQAQQQQLLQNHI